MLKVWGRLTSINVRKVVWAVQELGLAFERQDAGMNHGVVDTPAYRALNPNGLVPVIEDCGFVLWESNSIVRYLCARYGTPDFYPIDLPERFDAERWMDWEATSLTPAGRDAFWQLYRTPEPERDMAAIGRSVKASLVKLAILDTHLATRRFMAGEAFSMADIPVGCSVHRFLSLPLQTPALPGVRRWLSEITDRPATRGVLDIPLG